MMPCTAVAIFVALGVAGLTIAFLFWNHYATITCPYHGRKSRYWTNCPYAEGWEYVCLKCEPDHSGYAMAGTKEPIV